MVQISALGCHKDHESRFFKTKALGEEAIKKHYPNATILRPSTIYGVDDRFLNFYAKLVRFSPSIFYYDRYFVILMIRGQTLIQPVSVIDVARAVSACFKNEKTAG